MTQAFNLAQFANNLNASGQAAAGTSLTGAVPVANGGTNLTTAPTNGQLLIGNGTGYTQAALTAGSGITVTNSAGGITITGAGVTSLGAIGAVQQLYYTSATTPIIAGTTVAGTSLLYPTSLVGMSTVGGGMILSGSLTTNSNTSALYVANGYIRRTISGNTGWVSPLGTTAATGTWRCIGGGAQPTASYYDSCSGDTTAYTNGSMFVRIS